MFESSTKLAETKQYLTTESQTISLTWTGILSIGSPLSVKQINDTLYDIIYDIRLVSVVQL
jgi:hypothetical protein